MLTYLSAKLVKKYYLFLLFPKKHTRYYDLLEQLTEKKIKIDGALFLQEKNTLFSYQRKQTSIFVNLTSKLTKISNIRKVILLDQTNISLNRDSKLSETDTDGFINKVVVMQNSQSYLLIKQASSKANIIEKLNLILQNIET